MAQALVACVEIPHVALRVAVLNRPELDGAPLVLGPPPGGRPRVADATPEAQACGIRPGMSLREVVALCPAAVILAPDPHREATVAEQVVTALEALSPLVEPAAPGRWFVDLRGLERQLGPPEVAAAQLRRAVPPALRPRVGVAPGKFGALVAARQAKPGTTRIIAPAQARAVLAPVPVAWLPVPPELAQQFEQLGLRTLRDLAALPGAKVAARFGPAGRQAWALACGVDDERVTPRRREEVVVEQLTLPAPTASRDLLLVALRYLVTRAFNRPALSGRHVRQVHLRTLLDCGGSWAQTITLRQATGGTQLGDVLALRLRAIAIPGAVEALTIELRGLVAESGRQEPFAIMRPRRDAPLVAAVRQLKQRYGASPVFRIVEVEPWSRIPERRHALIAYDP